MSGGGSGEKTELPTPKKERDARQKGQVARSQEVVTTVSLSAAIAYVWFNWGTANTRLTGMFDQMAKLATGDFRQSAILAIHLVFWDSMLILGPLLGIVILAGIAANYFQIGSLFTLDPIKPKGEKVSPISGFKRIFSMKQVFEFLKSIIKIIVLSTILYFVIRNAIAPFVEALSCGTTCLRDITVAVLGQTLIYSMLAFIVVAAADFAYQKRSHTKSLMMTKEEVKREYKESEGDPHIKGKRKQLAQELAMTDGTVAASKGTAVIVNPTHFAVVIDYKPEVMALPVVTAKGRNIQAHQLRVAAEEAGVPVFRNVALARTLFSEATLYEPIADELFDVVAEVLAWVEKNRARLYGGRLDHGVIDMEMGDHRKGRE